MRVVLTAFDLSIIVSVPTCTDAETVATRSSRSDGGRGEGALQTSRLGGLEAHLKAPNLLVRDVVLLHQRLHGYAWRSDTDNSD